MASVRFTVDHGRVQRRGETWRCAHARISLPDGTPVEATTAIRESDLRALLAQSVGLSPGPLLVGSFGAPTLIYTDASGLQIWYKPSSDAFKSDVWMVTNGRGATLFDQTGLFSVNARNGNATDPASGFAEARAWLDANKPRAASPRSPAPAPRLPGAGGGGISLPGGGRAVVSVGPRTVSVPPTTPAAGGGGGRSNPSGGAVVAVSAETARKAGMPIPPVSAPSGGLVKIGDPSITVEQQYAALSSLAQSLAQRLAAGAVDPSGLDMSNQVESTALQWAPYVPPDANAVPATPGSTVYPDATVPGGLAALAPLPPDAAFDGQTGYVFAWSTGLYYDAATHQAFFPPDAYQDPTGYIYAPSTCGFYDPSTGAVVAQQCYPQAQPQAYAQPGYYGDDVNAYLAQMWSAYGGVHGLNIGSVGDFWGDLGKAAEAFLGNDVTQKVLAVATPILMVAQPEIGLALAAGEAVAHAAMSGQVHPEQAKQQAHTAAKSADPLERLAASVFRALTGA